MVAAKAGEMVDKLAALKVVPKVEKRADKWVATTVVWKVEPTDYRMDVWLVVRTAAK